MAKTNLREYLSDGRKSGMSFDFLRGELLEAGYKERDIEEAIHEVRSRYRDSFFSKIWKSLFAPRQLFETVKADSIGTSFGYLLGLLFIAYLFFGWQIASFIKTTTLPTSQFIGSWGEKINYAPLGLQISFILIFYFICLIIIAWIASIIFSSIFHVFVKLFKGKGSYRESYGIFSYSATPILLALGPCSIIILNKFFGSTSESSYQIVLGILAFAFLWRVMLMIIGNIENHGMSAARAILSVLALIIIMALVMFSLKGSSVKEKVQGILTPSNTGSADSGGEFIPSNEPSSPETSIDTTDYNQYAEPG
ncbi:YIP1 family protein [Candidatus Pacearchaeota archaeon]|nr:YIP1 family protein [Candidatus Pacearchaeota archaeon]